MKAGLAAVAILVTLSATAWMGVAHARTVVIKRTITTTTVTTRTVTGGCSCLRRHVHRHIWAVRSVPSSYSRYFVLSSYWTFTPPWITSLAAAPYE